VLRLDRGDHARDEAESCRSSKDAFSCHVWRSLGAAGRPIAKVA
jgi:hypothetical protein